MAVGERTHVADYADEIVELARDTPRDGLGRLSEIFAETEDEYGGEHRPTWSATAMLVYG